MSKRRIAVITVAIALASVLFAVVQGFLETHRTGVAFKNELISRVTAPTADAVVTGRQLVGDTLDVATGLPLREIEQREYLRVRKRWTKTRYEISATLAAAFTGDGLVADWDNFAAAVESYLRLSSHRLALDDAVKKRNAQALKLKEYFSLPSTDFRALVDGPRQRPSAYASAYFRVSQLAGARLSALTKAIGAGHLESLWIAVVSPVPTRAFLLDHLGGTTSVDEP